MPFLNLRPPQPGAPPAMLGAAPIALGLILGGGSLGAHWLRAGDDA
ncbi:MAG: hypothetical protein Q8K58_15335 [Acidimicrobiales bacterium]|nr:hypothetical protein [Acidimicrobiales bacterium]